MNDDIGLGRLQRLLRQTKNAAVLRSLEDVRCELIRSATSDERTTAIRKLDRLAYRYAGASFDSLCTQNEPSFSDRFFSLRRLLYSLLLLLLLPGFAAVFAVPNQQITQIDQAEQKTHSIDLLIASWISSPFYLNPVKEACSQTPLQQLHMTRVAISLSELTDEGCVWTYTDTISSEVIVMDYWTSQGLSMRKYLAGNEVIAQDDFNPSSDECFKRRTYLNNGSAFISQCFSEAGIPSGEDIFTVLRSPIPPPFYWFFYR